MTTIPCDLCANRDQSYKVQRLLDAVKRGYRSLAIVNNAFGDGWGGIKDTMEEMDRAIKECEDDEAEPE